MKFFFKLILKPSPFFKNKKVLFLKKYFLSRFQYQNKKALFTGAIFPKVLIYSSFFFAVRCTNSLMGRITEAMVQLRRRVTEVDVLILEDNNIPHLPSRAFGSVKINRLFIENNRIKTIDRNAFAGIEDFLTELYIKVSERMSYN